MYNIDDIKEYLKNNLSLYRYEHSLRVADLAIFLAPNYNVNKEDAYVAGLLHDIAKEFDSEKNKYYIDKYNIDKKYQIDTIIHSFVGSVYAKELYNISDDIMNAIKYHTVGNINMNNLAKIIFVADKLDRKNTDEELKQLALTNIDEVLKQILISSRDYLKGKNIELHEDSCELLKSLEEKEVL